MKILLIETIKNLGNFGSTITVKSGFARNYLIKYGKAVFSSNKNINIFKKQKNKLKKNYENSILDNIQKYKKLKQLNIVFKKKTIDGEKLYGSIKEYEILEKINTCGIFLKKTEIKNLLIRNVGTHNIEFTLNPGNINFTIVVQVEKL